MTTVLTNRDSITHDGHLDYYKSSTNTWGHDSCGIFMNVCLLLKNCVNLMY